LFPFLKRSEGLSKTVEIAIVGKYTTQSDTYTSIHKALEHAGLESNRKVVIKVNEILNFKSSYRGDFKYI
jgi:CTP synthase (UTP-ammonia lyase)